jgi:hypothetical protein
LRKCLDLGYVSQTFYETKVEEWEKDRLGRVSSESHANYYRTQGAYLSNSYVETAFGKYFQGVISKSQLADYFGMKEANVSKFEGYILNR